MELLELLLKAMYEFYHEAGRLEIQQSSCGGVEVKLMRGAQVLVTRKSIDVRQAIFDVADYWYSSVWRKR